MILKIMYKSIQILIVIIVLLRADFVSAWQTVDNSSIGEGVHQKLSEYASLNSVLRSCIDSNDSNCGYLRYIGFNNELYEKVSWFNGDEVNFKPEIIWWLAKGAEAEDAGVWYEGLTANARYLNHFHNPLKKWDEAGLNGPFWLNGNSSLMWSQDDSIQGPSWPEGDWSMPTIKKYFYWALTLTTQVEREMYLAFTFRGLGHQVHLLADKAVPAHVRNDMHPLGDTLENWGTTSSYVLRCLFEDHSTFHSVNDAALINFCNDNPDPTANRPSFPQVNVKDYYPQLTFDTDSYPVDQTYFIEKNIHP